MINVMSGFGYVVFWLLVSAGVLWAFHLWVEWLEHKIIMRNIHRLSELFGVAERRWEVHEFARKWIDENIDFRRLEDNYPSCEQVATYVTTEFATALFEAEALAEEKGE